MHRTREPRQAPVGIAGLTKLLLGADDCILKPFHPAVLLSRVNGVFRRLKVMAA